MAAQHRRDHKEKVLAKEGKGRYGRKLHHAAPLKKHCDTGDDQSVHSNQKNIP